MILLTDEHLVQCRIKPKGSMCSTGCGLGRSATVAEIGSKTALMTCMATESFSPNPFGQISVCSTDAPVRMSFQTPPLLYCIDDQVRDRTEEISPACHCRTVLLATLKPWNYGRLKRADLLPLFAQTRNSISGLAADGTENSVSFLRQSTAVRSGVSNLTNSNRTYTQPHTVVSWLFLDV
nr:hypothetical protein CFP56_12139 [Quercus suber]